jgi:hypothetical protein
MPTLSPWPLLVFLAVAAIAAAASPARGADGMMSMSRLPAVEITYDSVDASHVEPHWPAPLVDEQTWTMQLLPNGLIYRSYLAGTREPRLASVWSHQSGLGEVWNAALGARVGLLRFGTDNDLRPTGFQLDFEGAVFPRLDPWADSNPLIASDFRAGFWMTYGSGPWHVKVGYYHTSAHLGDEFLLANPGFPRINYVRDEALVGVGYYWADDVRLYAEAGYALGIDGGAEPWEFQFGAEYSPIANRGWRGAPFAAANVNLREEIQFSGNLVTQLGWQWLNVNNGRRFRVGVQYFVGKSDDYEFFRRHESRIGGGTWFDF